MDENGNVENVTGNTCKRGEVYARNEVKNPVRVVTSTVKIDGGKEYSVSVKTADAIPKNKMNEVEGRIGFYWHPAKNWLLHLNSTLDYWTFMEI